MHGEILHTLVGATVRPLELTRQPGGGRHVYKNLNCGMWNVLGCPDFGRPTIDCSDIVECASRRKLAAGINRFGEWIWDIHLGHGFGDLIW